MNCSSRRLAYEPLGPGHAAELLAALGDPRVNEHFAQPEPSSLGAMLAQLRLLCAGPPRHRSHERWLNFAVRLTGGRLIGRIEATIAGTSAELAYLFDPSAWGHGYASEAVEWLEEYCRATAGVLEFWAAVPPANERSIRLLTRLRYRELEPAAWPNAATFEPGFRVFRRSSGT